MTPDDEVTALFRKEAGHLRGYLIKCGAGEDEAHDCVQDGFLAVARLGGCLENPLAYAYKVARRQLTKIRKSAGRELPAERIEDTTDSTEPDPADALIQRQEQDEVRRALDSLPPNRSKEAITLRFINGFSLIDAAAIMEISTGAVKRYTHDGLAAIRAIVKDENGEGESR